MLSKQELIAKTLYEASLQAQTILDVGFAQHANPDLKGDVYGIDIMEVPKPPHYKETKRMDLNTDAIPYPDGFFDAVGMGCTLAHVANPVRLMEDLHRTLKPGGVIVLSSPNPSYYWEVIMNVWFHFFSKRVSKSKFEEHFFSFSRYNMRTMALRTGFTIEREVGCSFQLVKTNFKFNPLRFPGMAYEIIYVFRKTGEGARYTLYEGAEGKISLPTKFS